MARLDTAQSVGRILQVTAALSLDQARARIAGFPVRTSELTAGWLTGVLGTRYPGVRVESFRVLDQHSGTTSRARLALDYEDRGAGQNAPETIFAKLTPGAFLQRIFVSLVGIGRNEVSFYNRAGDSTPIRTPRLHGLQSLGNGRLFTLLLEDLSQPEVRFATVGDRATLEDAEQVIHALATLHAAFLESPRFKTDLSWVPTPESRKKNLPWERFVTNNMIRIALKKFSADFGSEFRAIANICSEERDRLEFLWGMGERTLIHGDCHIGNLFFEPGGVGFLDWQVCAAAPGMRDVSYFLCNSFPTELRRSHEVELIQAYLDELKRQGVAAPSFDLAWQQHRLFALYTWIAAAFTAAAGSGLQSREIGIAGLRRATKAAIDLESVDCVRSYA